MKQVTVKLFLVIISVFLICCEKEPIIPENYNVAVYNGYFETIDSLMLNDNELLFLDVNSYSNQIELQKGIYPLRFSTQSGLLFSAEIKIQGYNADLILFVDKNGEITIRQDDR